MKKKIMYINIPLSDFICTLFGTLYYFNKNIEYFKEQNGTYPDEIHIPQFNMKGIPIKTDASVKEFMK